MKVSTSEEYAHDLLEWHEDFVIAGNNENPSHKSGSQAQKGSLAPKIAAATLLGVVLLAGVVFVAIRLLGTDSVTRNGAGDEQSNPVILEATTAPPPTTAAPSPTAATNHSGQPVAPVSTMAAPPDACADHGGTAFTGDICVCPGIIDHVVICADNTKFDNPTTNSCIPNEACSGGDTGGAPTCTLTVAECNANGFADVDPATCTCFGNYKP